MTGAWLFLLIAAPLSFAVTRIAIRLQQQPGLAALTSALICWQGIALAVGRAPLAGAMALLIAACVVLALVQWLNQTVSLKLWLCAALLALTGVLWGNATLFPLLRKDQALGFLAALLLVALGAGIAVSRARAPVPEGGAGLGPLVLLALWLAIRSAASFG